MTAIGKSDIFEAITQIVVLRILYERDETESRSLVRELRRRTKGLNTIQNASGHLALYKLESSGWIQRTTPSGANSEIYRLSNTAKRYLAKEFEDWRTFVDQWPRIEHILQKVLGLPQ